MAKQLSTTLQRKLTAAQKLYTEGRTAVDAAHMKAREALAAIYNFAHAAQGDAAVEDMYRVNKITIREGDGGNPFLYPVKYCIGTADIDEHGAVVGWNWDRPRLAQYGNICWYANHEGIAPKDFLNWLLDPERGGGTITKANNLAVASGKLPGPRRSNPVAAGDVDPLEAINKLLAPRWNAAVGNSPTISVDMNVAGLTAGFVELVGEADKDGNITLLGAVPMSADAAYRAALRMPALKKPHTAFIKLCTDARAADAEQLQIVNREDMPKVRIGGDPLFKLDAPVSFLALDTHYTIQRDAINAVVLLDRNFVDLIWSATDTALVAEVPTQPFLDAVLDLNTKRDERFDQKKQKAIEAGKPAPFAPERFELPVPAQFVGDAVHIPVEVK